jgi:replicative DNA helicase
MKPYDIKMTKLEIIDRLLVAIASYDEKLETRLKNNTLTPKDKQRLEDAMETLADYPIFVNDVYSSFHINLSNMYLFNRVHE